MKRDQMLRLFSAIDYLLKVFFEQRIKLRFELFFTDVKGSDETIPLHLDQENLFRLIADGIQLLFVKEVPYEQKPLPLVLVLVNHGPTVSSLRRSQIQICRNRFRYRTGNACLCNRPRKGRPAFPNPSPRPTLGCRLAHPLVPKSGYRLTRRSQCGNSWSCCCDSHLCCDSCTTSCNGRSHARQRAGLSHLFHSCRELQFCSRAAS